jgi:hypothetical protein
MSPVVPKVTAFTETAVVWAVLNGDLARARELVGSMLPAERHIFEEQLSVIVRMLWGEQT